MRRRLEAGLDLHEVDAAGHRALLIELFDEMMAGIEAAERREGGFVSDRTPLDFIAFWLYYGMGWDAAASDAAMARFAAGLARYDAVVLLPWGAIPLEDDGIRSPNRWHQYHFQMILEGLLGSVEAAPPILRMPAAIVSPDARLGWLIEAAGMETVDRVAP